VTAIIILAVYLAGFTVIARRSYGTARPSRVPLCGEVHYARSDREDAWKFSGRDQKWARHIERLGLDQDGHVPAGKQDSCYGGHTAEKAVGISVLTGAVWPLWLVFVLFLALIVRGQRDRADEKQARAAIALREHETRLKRQEAELEQREADLETATRVAEHAQWIADHSEDGEPRS
jgi:hypothetical protein